MLQNADIYHVPCMCVHKDEFDEDRKNVVNGYDIFNQRILNDIVFVPFNRIDDLKRNSQNYAGSWISVVSVDVFWGLPIFIRDELAGDTQ